MKVKVVIEDKLIFDNELTVTSWHTQECCEDNYLDFEQFKVGDEFEDCDSVLDFMKLIKIKEDGFILKDKSGIPKWAQARSSQNGYYSNMLGIKVSLDDECYRSSELLEGEEIY